MDTNDFLIAAERIVQEAGIVAKEMLPRSQVLRHKKYREIVTEGDIRVEEYVISSLRKVFPSHGFDSEEREQENPDAEYVWTLDPIDGTKYYAKGVPLYAVSLALKQRGQEYPILGVVYSPEFERTYCAALGAGATLNGHDIHCNGGADLEKASICLEIPSRDSPRDELQWAMEKMSLLVEQAFRVRIIGVGSLGLCFCASGGFDAYLNLGSMWKCHDVAAGQVIVREAGGEFLCVGEKGRQIVAGPGPLCETIRDTLEI